MLLASAFIETGDWKVARTRRQECLRYSSIRQFEHRGSRLRNAGLETGDTADLEICATFFGFLFGVEKGVRWLHAAGDELFDRSQKGFRY